MYGVEHTSRAYSTVGAEKVQSCTVRCLLEVLLGRTYVYTSPNIPVMASSAGGGAADPATLTEKLDLLRRAYRVLKHDFEDRERALASERAQHATTITECTALAKRAEAAERELHEVKESVRSRAEAARAMLRAAMDSTDGGAAATLGHANTATSPSTTVVSSLSPSMVQHDSSSSGGASYQRGMEWADRIMSHATTFSAALSTSLESVGGLAVPATVQQQLEHQEQLIEAHADIATALSLEAMALERALVHDHVDARTQLDRARQQIVDLATQLEGAGQQQHDAVATAIRQVQQQTTAAAQQQLEQHVAAVQASATAQIEQFQQQAERYARHAQQLEAQLHAVQQPPQSQPQPPQSQAWPAAGLPGLPPPLEPAGDVSAAEPLLRLEDSGSEGSDAEERTRGLVGGGLAMAASTTSSDGGGPAGDEAIPPDSPLASSGLQLPPIPDAPLLAAQVRRASPTLAHPRPPSPTLAHPPPPCMERADAVGDGGGDGRAA